MIDLKLMYQWLNQLGQPGIEFIFTLGIASSGLLVVAWMFTKSLSRTSADTRFRIWNSAIICSVVIPFLALMPGIPVGAPIDSPSSASLPTELAVSSKNGPQAVGVFQEPHPEELRSQDVTLEKETSPADNVATSESFNGANAPFANFEAQQTSEYGAFAAYRIGWKLTAVLIWLCGVCCQLFFFVRAHFRTQRTIWASSCVSTTLICSSVHCLKANGLASVRINS